MRLGSPKKQPESASVRDWDKELEEAFKQAKSDRYQKLLKQIRDPATPEAVKRRIKGFFEDEKKEVVAFLNKNYAVINLKGSTLVMYQKKDPDYHPDRYAYTQDRIQLEFFTLRDFRARWMNFKIPVNQPTSKSKWRVKLVNYADVWLHHKERMFYDGLDFRPDGNIPKERYNLWPGWLIKPGNYDCSLYWNHVKDNICSGDDELYIYVRKWMAHAIQKPEKLPGTALVLRGGQGIGKNTFADIFGEIFGNAFIAFTSIEQITGRFNGALQDKILIHANEAFWGGYRKEEGVLKSMITDPRQYIELKGKEAFITRNYKRLIVSSNKDWAVPVELGDRRFVFCNVSNQHRDDHDYFRAIWDQMIKNGGLHGLMQDLQQEDLTNWTPAKRPAGNTSAGMDIKALNMDPYEEFIIQWLETGNWDLKKYQKSTDVVGGYEIPRTELYRQYEDWCESNHVTMVGTQTKFGSQVWNKKLPVLRDKRIGSLRVSIIPNLKECREYFEKHVLYSTHEWDKGGFSSTTTPLAGPLQQTKP